MRAGSALWISVTSFRYTRKAGVDEPSSSRAARANTACLGVWFAFGAGHAGHDSGLWKCAALADQGGRTRPTLPRAVYLPPKPSSGMKPIHCCKRRWRNTAYASFCGTSTKSLGSPGGCRKRYNLERPGKLAMRCTSTCAAEYLDAVQRYTSDVLLAQPRGQYPRRVTPDNANSKCARPGPGQLRCGQRRRLRFQVHADLRLRRATTITWKTSTRTAALSLSEAAPAATRRPTCSRCRSRLPRARRYPR